VRTIGYIIDLNLTIDDNGNSTLILAKNKPDISSDWIQIPEDASSHPPTDEEMADAIIGTRFALLK
tara:strand:- start:29339 stop:29536 length:198 start_codon:yes stop_codon:yes gene_type:complete